MSINPIGISSVELLGEAGQKATKEKTIAIVVLVVVVLLKQVGHKA